MIYIIYVQWSLAHFRFLQFDARDCRRIPDRRMHHSCLFEPEKSTHYQHTNLTIHLNSPKCIILFFFLLFSCFSIFVRWRLCNRTLFSHTHLHTLFLIYTWQNDRTVGYMCPNSVCVCVCLCKLSRSIHFSCDDCGSACSGMLSIVLHLSNWNRIWEREYW